MTAALMCDACGRLASERGPDDALDAWYELTPAPAITAGLLRPMRLPVMIDVDAAGDLVTHIPPPSDEEPDEPAPPSHFCSLTCLRDWAATAAELAP